MASEDVAAQSQALVVHDTNPMTTPPCDYEFHKQFYQDLHGRRIKYDAPTVRRLARGLGMNEADREALLAKAVSLLPPGPAVNMKTIQGRRVKEDAETQLLQDSQFSRYFRQAFPAQYGLAIRFFNEAAERWILAGNRKRRSEQQPEEEEEGGEGVEGMEDTSGGGVVTSQPGRIAIMAYTLEIRDMQTNHLAVCVLNDLFETGSKGPEPANLNIDTIRAFYRSYHGANARDVRRFHFWARDMNGFDREFFIIDDPSLRYAYRLWLGMDDVELPFVLFVDDVAAN